MEREHGADRGQERYYSYGFHGSLLPYRSYGSVWWGPAEMSA
jgi:hypothetical protein